MKGLCLVAILSMVTLAVVALDKSLLLDDIPTECPEIDSMNFTIHLAHESDCTKYYICFIGQKIERDCPFMDKSNIRLHFNPRQQICDWPHRAGCSAATTTSTPTDYITIPTSTSTLTPTPGDVFTSTFTLATTPKRNIISNVTFNPDLLCPKNTWGKAKKIRHDTKCDHYYLCIDGNISEKKCRGNNLFNPRYNMCDLPKNVDCDYITLPTTPTPTNQCPPKGSGIQVLHECNCDKYYECLDGEMILKVCPKGMRYDYVKKGCYLASTVSCMSFTSPNIEITTIKNIECSKNEEGIRFQHEFDCSIYYECKNNQKVLKACTAGLHFNVTLQTCEYPTKECQLTTKTSSNKSSIMTASTTMMVPSSGNSLGICPTEGNKLLPHECSCTIYYKCTNGLPIVEICPTNKHFDYITHDCKEPEKAKCFSSASTEITTEKFTTPKEVDDDCPTDENKITRLPHERDCQLYYICVKRKKILLSCRSGHLFNSKFNLCDLPKNVDCHGRSTDSLHFTAKYSYVSMPPLPSFKKCPAKGFSKIPHENDCKKYYECFDGEKILRMCKQNFHFNPNVKMCDLPENYSCKNDAMTKEEMIAMEKELSNCIGNCPSKDPSNYTVLLPHKDCKKYCMCSNGIPYVQPCPANLHFDSIEMVCNYPGVAVCAVPPNMKNISKKDEERSKNYESESNDEYYDKSKSNDKWYKLPFVSRFF